MMLWGGLWLVQAPCVRHGLATRKVELSKNNQFNLMYVLTVIASCGGGKKAESRRRVSVNVLVLILLVG